MERRDTFQGYGLVWERERIEKDRAHNQDYIVLDLDPTLSTPPQDERGWRILVIEGDNPDVLRALRLTHAGRMRCILIDPPMASCREVVDAADLPETWDSAVPL